MKPKSLPSIFFLSALLMLAACGGDEIEAKREKLKKSKTELAKLQTEIAKLEAELEGTDTIAERLTPVEVKELRFEPFYHSIQVSGTMEAEENITISPEASGQVKAIFVKEGDRVSKGQTLAQLNTSTIEANIAEVNTSLDLANTVYERQKRLWEQKIGSEMQYLEAKNRKESLENRLTTLRSQLSMSIVRAPVSGVVDAIYKKEGELVMPGVPLLQLVNLDNMKIIADVSESYIKSINKGDTVRVTLPALGNEIIEAPVSRTSNIINLKNRSFSVEVKLPNRSGVLKPNSIGIIEIVDYYNDSSLVVPTRAISKDSHGEFVYVVKEKDGKPTAFKIRINSGLSSEGYTRILSGLAPGDRVVTKGYNEVSDTAPVSVKANI